MKCYNQSTKIYGDLLNSQTLVPTWSVPGTVAPHLGRWAKWRKWMDGSVRWTMRSGRMVDIMVLVPTLLQLLLLHLESQSVFSLKKASCWKTNCKPIFEIAEAFATSWMVPVRWRVWGGFVLIFTEIQGICIQEADEMLGSTDQFFLQVAAMVGWAPGFTGLFLLERKAPNRCWQGLMLGCSGLANLALHQNR